MRVRELRHEDARRRRAMRAEVALARRAEHLEVLPRHDEHSELDDGVDAEPVRRQARAEILQRELDLLAEAGRNGPVGAHADLARDEHELAAALHDGRVRVRPGRRVHVARVQERRRHGREVL
jgi:hypothetical protein